MIRLRPHTLQYLVETPGTEAPNGDYIAGEKRFNGAIPCRVAYAQQAREIRFDDGRTFVPRYVVYLDQDVRAFKRGERVRLLHQDAAEECEVVDFKRDQLHARLWV